MGQSLPARAAGPTGTGSVEPLAAAARLPGDPVPDLKGPGHPARATRLRWLADPTHRDGKRPQWGGHREGYKRPSQALASVGSRLLSGTVTPSTVLYYGGSG